MAGLAIAGCTTPHTAVPESDSHPPAIETEIPAPSLPSASAPSRAAADAGQASFDDHGDLDGDPLPSLDPDTLPPFTDNDWQQPEAVAARAVVLLTNHRFREDGTTVTARLGPYCTALFHAELAATSTATAASTLWAAADAIAVGHVTTTVVVTNDSRTATVTVWATVAVTTADHPDVPLEPDPYQVLLARQPDGRWLVAGLTL